jgi:hypothetical protein
MMGMNPGLPSGLSIGSSTGIISGIPTTTGSRTFTVRATKGACVYDKSYTINVCGSASFFTNSLQSGAIGTPYNQTISQMGISPATFSISAGALPDGLSISSSGTISGTPSALAVASTFTVLVTNGSCSISKEYTISICPSVTLSPSTLSNPTQGVAYSQQFTQTGFSGAHNFINFTGTLPTGLSLSSEGLLSGTPTEAGDFSFGIGVTDGSSCGRGAMYSVTVAAGCVASITPATLTDAERGVSESVQLTATGITSPSFSVSAGTLPTGISLSTAGLLSGTPSATGSFNFTVTATNGSCSANRAYTWVVACPFASPAPTISAGGPTTFCEGGSVTLTASGSADGYIWTNGATGKTITVTEDGGIGVRAITAGCTTSASQQTLIMVNPAPIAPSISGTAALPAIGGSVVLTAETGYNSYLWSTGATTQSITVTSEGSYTVRGTNFLGCLSQASAPAVITRGTCGSPFLFNACGSTISVSCAKLGSTTFFTEWTAEPTVFSSYQLQWRRTDISSGWLASPTYDGTRNGFKIENLLPNTPHELRFVVTCVATGVRTTTNAVQIQTLNLLCSNPAVTADTIGATRVALKWASNSGISSYDIGWAVSVNSGWSWRTVLLNNNTTNLSKGYRITGLQPNTSYTYRIRVTCANGYRDLTRYTYGTFTTAAAPACMTPTPQVVSQTSNTISLTWPHNPLAAKAYYVRWQLAGTSTWVTSARIVSGGSNVNYTIATNLFAGLSYNVQLSAICSKLDEAAAWSSSIVCTTNSSSTCFTPAIDSLKELSGRAVAVYWTATSNVASYEISRRVVGGSTWSVPNVINGASGRYNMSYNFFPISLGNNYEVRMRAKCADNGVWVAYQYKTITLGGGAARAGISEAINLSVYPNPSNGVVNISAENLNEAAMYYVYNAMGQMVASGEISSETTSLDLSSQANGMYLIKVVSNGAVQTKHISINR